MLWLLTTDNFKVDKVDFEVDETLPVTNGDNRMTAFQSCFHII